MTAAEDLSRAPASRWFNDAVVLMINDTCSERGEQLSSLQSAYPEKVGRALGIHIRKIPTTVLYKHVADANVLYVII